MNDELAAPIAGPWGSEQQLVRLNGTVLISLVVPAHQRLFWWPQPGMDIRGPCAGRVRELPGRDWKVIAYFPEGFPGPQEPWPLDALNEGETSWPGSAAP